VPPPAVRSLSDQDLDLYVRELSNEINNLGSQIALLSPSYKRVVKIVRASILTAGGFIAASEVDVLGLVLTVFGVWEWVEAFAEDAEEMNRELAMRRNITRLRVELAVAEAEIDRRLVIPTP
jgi:sugar-specific transcriptional regulator TrmB